MAKEQTKEEKLQQKKWKIVFDDLTSRLKKGDLVYYIESNRGIPHTVVAPDYEKTQNTYPSRMLGIYSPSDMHFSLKFEPRALLSLWNYDVAGQLDVPGFNGIRLKGILRYGDSNIHVGNISEIVIGPERLRETLIPDLKLDRDAALTRIEEDAMKDVITGRYQKLINAIERL